MKRLDLERELTRLGYRFLRHGGSHDIWTNGTKIIPVPRHSEVVESTAKKILKRARTP